jgi:RING finger/CHY zinc finger protein 1
VHIFYSTECRTAQEPSATCTSCGVTFANSFCPICMIWTQRDIYHCVDCAICRVGGADEHFHCKTCNACFPKVGEDTHECIFRRSVDQLSCPFCLEDVFSSQDAINPMRCCGQAAHHKCMVASLHAQGYGCPNCRKSFVDMTREWSEITFAIQAQPMPPEYDREVDINCNDCGASCKARFHFLGVQCAQCESYNTQIL